MDKLRRGAEGHDVDDGDAAARPGQAEMHLVPGLRAAPINPERRRGLAALVYALTFDRHGRLQDAL